VPVCAPCAYQAARLRGRRPGVPVCARRVHTRQHGCAVGVQVCRSVRAVCIPGSTPARKAARCAGLCARGAHEAARLGRGGAMSHLRRRSREPPRLWCRLGSGWPRGRRRDTPQSECLRAGRSQIPVPFEHACAHPACVAPPRNRAAIPPVAGLARARLNRATCGMVGLRSIGSTGQERGGEQRRVCDVTISPHASRAVP
jgi:hypothetical protein